VRRRRSGGGEGAPQRHAPEEGRHGRVFASNRWKLRREGRGAEEGGLGLGGFAGLGALASGSAPF